MSIFYSNSEISLTKIILFYFIKNFLMCITFYAFIKPLKKGGGNILIRRTKLTNKRGSRSLSFSSCTTTFFRKFIQAMSKPTSSLHRPDKAASVCQHAATSIVFRIFYKPSMHVQHFQRGVTYIQTQEPVSENKAERGREWEQPLSSNHKEAHSSKPGGHKGNSSMQFAYETVAIILSQG